MTPSNTNNRVRRAKPYDIPSVVAITKENEHYWTPEVDGAEALARVMERDTNVFLVHEDPGRRGVAGFVLGSWDGARAVIHKLSVRPDCQNQGVGKLLVAEAVEEFKKMGAPTVGVTAADGTRKEEENDSTGFWKKVGFVPIPARLMINFSIWDDEMEG